MNSINILLLLVGVFCTKIINEFITVYLKLLRNNCDELLLSVTFFFQQANKTNDEYNKGVVGADSAK